MKAYVEIVKFDVKDVITTSEGEYTCPTEGDLD